MADADVTEFLPDAARTEAAEWAWSDETDDAEGKGVDWRVTLERESWGTTVLTAVVLVISGLAVALAVGFALWAEFQHNDVPHLQTVAPGDVRPQ